MSDIVGAVRRELEELITGHPMADSLRAMALSLASSLDGDSGMMQAALNRELRETITMLTGEAVTDDDDLAALLSEPEVSAEVRDAENFE